MAGDELVREWVAGEVVGNEVGYLHKIYAESHGEYGTPIALPRSKGWIIKRPINGTEYFDAMGCYPLFSCADWTQLTEDLDSLGSDMVAVSLVADPFGGYRDDDLRKAFPDLVRPYKEHLVTDLSLTPADFVNAHHRRNARTALDHVQVEVTFDLPEALDDWTRLYANLVERHKIAGPANFSRRAFELQFAVPGMTVFNGRRRNQTIGMLLWFIRDDTAYYHLGAYDAEGYRLKASFALFWTAIEYFRARGIRWLALGAGAGVVGDPTDGLTRFKSGWSTGTRASYLCGRVLDRTKYAKLSLRRSIPPSDYFPLYRAP